MTNNDNDNKKRTLTLSFGKKPKIKINNISHTSEDKKGKKTLKLSNMGSNANISKANIDSLSQTEDKFIKTFKDDDINHNNKKNIRSNRDNDLSLVDSLLSEKNNRETKAVSIFDIIKENSKSDNKDENSKTSEHLKNTDINNSSNKTSNSNPDIGNSNNQSNNEYSGINNSKNKYNRSPVKNIENVGKEDTKKKNTHYTSKQRQKDINDLINDKSNNSQSLNVSCSSLSALAKLNNNVKIVKKENQPSNNDKHKQEKGEEKISSKRNTYKKEKTDSKENTSPIHFSVDSFKNKKKETNTTATKEKTNNNQNNQSENKVKPHKEFTNHTSTNPLLNKNTKSSTKKKFPPHYLNHHS
ncbi:MAG TPA: hypothetical protein QKA14_01005, partial [Candidatus Megaira endosymbiont of Hartmannula sinica]|nr:hypothetical protein [Candidatus Megaera endosymbiont of Hartmannula sinica]